MIRQRNVEGKARWGVLDMTNLSCSPSDPSRNDVWKVEGVSTFPEACWFGDMVSTYLVVFIDIAMSYA